MTNKLSVVGHVDTSQPQRPAGSSAVRIFANANAQIARGANSERAREDTKYCADYTPALAKSSMETAMASSAGSHSRTSTCAPLCSTCTSFTSASESSATLASTSGNNSKGG